MISKRERSGLSNDGARLFDLYEKGQHPPLLAEVDQLSKAGPLAPEVLGVASLALTALDRYDEATKAAAIAIKGQPGTAWLFHALAAAEAGKGRQAEAVSIERKAAQLMPGAALYGATLARYLRLSGHLDEARRTVEQSLAADPSSSIALVESGLCLHATGETDAAIAQLRAAQQADPSDPAGVLHEGVLMAELGRKSEARSALRTVLRLRPNDEEAENRLAQTLIGRRTLGGRALQHLLAFGRIGLLGWLAIAFFYYLWFRLIQFVWHLSPATLPAGRIVLLGTLGYLIVVGVAGRTLRVLFRRGWPR